MLNTANLLPELYSSFTNPMMPPVMRNMQIPLLEQRKWSCPPAASITEVHPPSPETTVAVMSACGTLVQVDPPLDVV